MNFDHQLKELAGSSRRIPSDKDFHFYYNFDEFRRPIEEIARRSHSILEKIGTSTSAWSGEAGLPVNIDDAYEWLLTVNDEALERADESVKDIPIVRTKKVEWGNGLWLECGKSRNDSGQGSGSGVGVGPNDKKKVSFHVATIKKPQEVYNIVVNNANQPFQHVWLEKSEDGQRFIHPLEKLSVLDFVDKDLENLVPLKPPPLDCTPLKLVEEVKGLKELAAKLHSVNEFAVDLEHNQYRSFQGLTCLMQISTRTEDFIVDTLKLRVHVGPYLREFFKDPTKKKVMHGADRDIVWLQRDFGIYVCNLFDTGQASRVLKLERYSLLFLLQHFCGITANKEYQNADWRQRPLPDVMLRYGREDTHYLLYIYDLMRIKLFAMSKDSDSSDNPLVEVYKRSYDVCMQLYEKELLTENSYLNIYGLQGAGFNAQQLAVVSGLCEWRDVFARAEDESTGYILPNKIILEIAKQMPVTTICLRRLLKSKLPYVENNLDVIVSIVRHSLKNASAFEEAAQRLKEAHAARLKEACMASVKDIAPVEDGIEAPSHSPKVGHAAKGSIGIVKATSPVSSDLKEESFQHENKNEQVKIKSNCITLELPRGNGANVQVLKEPTGALVGPLPGDSGSKQKLDPDQKGKEPIKVEQIRPSGNPPVHSFSGNSEKSKLVETPSVASETLDSQKPVSGLVSSSPVDIITLDSDSDLEDSMQNNLEQPQ